MRISNIGLTVVTIVLLIIGGCADSSTTGNIKEVNPKLTMNFTNVTGNVNINPFLDTASTAGDVDQDTENSANIDPRSTVPVGFGGGTASGAIGGDSVLDEIVSRFDPDIDASQENVGNPVDNSDNSAVTPAVVPSVIPVSNDTVIDPDLTGYEVETHNLKHMHDNTSEKLFHWLDHTGSYYGKNIIVKFSDGESWIVEDGEYAKAADGNLDNHNQMYWFSGNLLVEGSSEVQKDRSGELASVFPSPSSSAKTVSLYYKK